MRIQTNRPAATHRIVLLQCKDAKKSNERSFTLPCITLPIHNAADQYDMLPVKNVMEAFKRFL